MGFYCYYEYNRNGYMDDLEEIRADIIKIGLDTLKALNRRRE